MSSLAILSDLSRLQFSKFLNVAALAAFIFDYCLTFSLEVEYVWGTKWTVSRIVFTLSRYLSFFSSSLTCYEALVGKGCGAFILGLDTVYTASIVLAEGVLILRTYALWERSRTVLFFLLFLAGTFIAAAQVTSLEIHISLPGDTTAFYQFHPSLCAYRSSRSAGLQYAFLAMYEIILQSMNSWRKFRTYRDVRSRTLITLYRDGVVYMSLIIVLSAMNMTVMVAAPITFIPALNTAQVAFHGVLASRIFFNLRQRDKQPYLSQEFPLENLRDQARSSINAVTQAERASGIRPPPAC